jgi:sugar transferase (PEP-CTERM system associated)
MIRIFNHYVSRMALALLAIDLALLSILVGPAAALALTIGMISLGMYQHRLHGGLRAHFLRTAPWLVIGAGLAGNAPLLLEQATHDRMLLLLAALLALLLRLLLARPRTGQALGARLLLIGAGMLARDCMTLATQRGRGREVEVVGCIPIGDEVRCVAVPCILATGESLAEIATRLRVTEIVVAVGDRRGGALPVPGLLDCAVAGIPVVPAAHLFEREASQIRLDTLHPSYLIFGGGFDQGWLRTATKRSFDIAAALVLVAASLPVLAAAALAILLDDGGPVLYAQERVGKDSAPFVLLKFRSMRRDAEQGGAPAWASEDDPRVTRVGRVLRALRIDELPQAWNVLRGDMSFVGPRPERPYFVNQLSGQVPFYHVRHRVKPGITGLAQVRYRYGASVADAIEKLQYDLYYVKNHSLFLDALLLIETVQVVVFAKGSR